jgi:hypothetical protein
VDYAVGEFDVLRFWWLVLMVKSWFDWMVKGGTCGFDHRARSLDTRRYDGILLLIQADRNDLPPSNIAPTNLAIQHKPRVVQIPRHELWDLTDVLGSDHTFVQMIPENLLDEARVEGRLLDAEDAAFGDNRGEGFVGGGEEGYVWLRGGWRGSLGFGLRLRGRGLGLLLWRARRLRGRGCWYAFSMGVEEVVVVVLMLVLVRLFVADLVRCA